MQYFISDCHFGHDAVIRICNRPFVNAEDMDEQMVKKWRNKVNGNDTIFILGDLIYKHADPMSVLKRLSGKKILIEGNHDNTWMSNVENLSKYFQNIFAYTEIQTVLGFATLCHYPMMTWRHSLRSYMLHGHIHNGTNQDYWTFLKSNPRILNTSVEINNYEPVDLNELVKNNEAFKNYH